jgi:hypothetical protein
VIDHRGHIPVIVHRPFYYISLILISGQSDKLDKEPPFRTMSFVIFMKNRPLSALLGALFNPAITAFQFPSDPSKKAAGSLTSRTAARGVYQIHNGVEGN